MSIIGSLPDNLTNGTTADASQVMADLNFIVNQVNANAVPLGTLAAPSGTRSPFQQASAPPGWTIDANTFLNDCSMRLNSITPGTGGTTPWSAWNFGSGFNVNSFTLSVAQLPPHSHPVSDPGHTHGVSDPGHNHTPPNQSFWTSAGGSTFGSGTSAISQAATTATAATGISINTAGTGIGTLNTGSGAAITPTFTTPQVKYADFIIGIKS